MVVAILVPSAMPAHAVDAALSVQSVPLAGKVRPPAKGAYVGVFRPPAPFNADSLDQYQILAGKKPALVMWYQPWAGASSFDRAACLAVMKRGAIPVITWEPWAPGNDPNWLQNPAQMSDYRLSRIASGAFDSHISSWAREIKSLGGPVMLRPLHEMNGNWYPWGGTVNGNSPTDYIRAWRRIHGIFAREGATNVTWVWSVNAASVPNTKQNHYSKYYPGASYVDWTAVSGFNWGRSRTGSRWQSFSSIYTAPLAYLGKLGKPIMLAEFGSVSGGGSKATWITDAYRRIRTQYPKVRAVVYYDKRESGLKGTQDWQINSSGRSATAYRRAVSPSHFKSSTPAALSVWRSRLSTAQWSYLNGKPQLYNTTVSRVTPTLTLSAPTVVSWGDTARLAGSLTWYAAPVRQRAIQIQASEDGVIWTSVRHVSTSSSGRFVAWLKPQTKTRYRAHFLGEKTLNARYSPVRAVTPKVGLGKPVVRTMDTTASTTTLVVNRPYALRGELRPMHPAGAREIVIQAYRLERTKWVRRRSLTATVADAGSSSQYEATLRLPSKGKWRIRAYHPADARHAATYSTWRALVVR